ncbi:MAG: sulfur carrier protein ThiS [Myxococcales bacterium]
MGLTIELNGETREVAAGATVASLLEELGVRGAVAVERNRRIVPRAERPAVQLEDGDRLEVVTFVGGG